MNQPETPLIAGSNHDLVNHGAKSRNRTFNAIRETLTDREATWERRIHIAGPRGVTLSELSEIYGVPQNEFSGRVTSLVTKNHCVRPGTSRPSKRGRPSSVIVHADFVAESEKPLIDTPAKRNTVQVDHNGEALLPGRIYQHQCAEISTRCMVVMKTGELWACPTKESGKPAFKINDTPAGSQWERIE